jgi:hypothetical protein
MKLILRLLLGVTVSMIAPGLACAACYGPDKALPAQTVSDFMNDPSSLLQSNANGGAGLISKVRDLIMSNPQTFPLVMGLLARANDGQQQAIGSGVGQAATLCVRPDPTFAGEIPPVATDTKYAGFTVFKTAYAAAVGDAPIGDVALGGVGGGPSSGSVGGQTNPLGSPSATSGLQTFTTNAFTNPSPNYFTSSVGSAGSASFQSTPIVSVSP